MKTILLGDIQIPPTRQRESFIPEDIQELAKDIQLPHGLLHPIVLRNDERTLVSGERRIRAIRYIWLLRNSTGYRFNGTSILPNQIPYVTLDELSEDELIEAELSENIRRIDLSWREKAIAITRLAELRRKQIPGLTNEALLTELDPTATNPTKTIEDNIVLANNLHRPAVRKAKSKNEALKILTQELNQEFTTMMAERFKPDASGSTHTLIHGDLLEWLPKLQPDSFDCIITDPPYGINADKIMGDQPSISHNYDDSPAHAWWIFKTIADESERLTKSQAHMYIFCDFSKFDLMADYLEQETTWKVWARPLIWWKGNTGIAAQPFHGPRYTYECILYANKGARRTLGLFNDVLSVPDLKDKIHAAQKPIELYADLLKRTCRPGDFILDPCCGSGTVFSAANRVSLRATGIELDINAHAYAVQALKAGL